MMSTARRSGPDAWEFVDGIAESKALLVNFVFACFFAAVELWTITHPQNPRGPVCGPAPVILGRDTVEDGIGISIWEGWAEVKDFF